MYATVASISSLLLSTPARVRRRPTIFDQLSHNQDKQAVFSMAISDDTLLRHLWSLAKVSIILTTCIHVFQLQKLTSLDNKLDPMSGRVSALENPINPAPTIIPQASGSYPLREFLATLYPVTLLIDRELVAHIARQCRTDHRIS